MILKDGLAPSLPTIGGRNVDVKDLALALYTHRPSSTYRRDRLAELGKMALGLVVTDHLFISQTSFDGEQIESKRDSVVADETILQWLDLYPDEKQRFLERDGVSASSSDIPKELCAFFLSYMGAVYLSQGRSIRPVLEDWVLELVNLERDEPSDEPSTESSSVDPPPPSYASAPPLATPPSSPVQRREPFSSSTSINHTSPGLHSPDGPSPRSEPVPKFTLELANQLQGQNRAYLTYQDVREGGSAHQPEWLAQCLVNGIEKGRGTGKSKKNARERAAREASIQLGWIKESDWS
ncbi:hypothetical protein GYMLUDRAFT_41677 [Collybiopsis luxurians FD-317 M1]|uniref:Uncharacterized protein n=1 Tax=Collybiopsis luxurians FD-317 M1 TaxID=944289 RepID=A0A0D0D133_9AGAR|nr:hypothetical protein GYMLUDRAFT_41677 [Collybiopsis luxurians FD-317 M1]